MIELDEGFDLWGNWYKDRLEGVPLDQAPEEKGLNIPAEVREQGVKATNTYLANLLADVEQQSLKPLNLVRAIFIGHGDAGKTSLIRRLHGEPVKEGKEKMTAGIEIREWPIPKTDIKARFWDFGGQVMSHSTHQFFLRERCLYIIVLDGRKDEEAEYWLEHVKAFGHHAPVMLVCNKADENSIALGMNTLQEKYSNIVDFYPMSCTSKKEKFTALLNVFSEDLTEQLTAVGTHQVMFTPNEFEVLDKIRKKARKNSFLTQQEFDDLCKEHHIGEKGLDKTDFLGLLDSLGEIVHFPDLQWADAYVLNPRWLTYGIYTLLYADQASEQQGVLSHADVVNILQAKVVEDELGNQLAYPKDKCRFIIDAMSSFKLCYHLSEQKFVIPDELPSDQPDLTDFFDKNAEGILTFEFVFKGLLPRNIMPNLIVARHQEISKDDERKQLVWQHGVVIDSAIHQSKACLQVDYHDRTLLLWLQGNNARDYLGILRDEVYKIVKVIKGLEFNEHVILPEFARVNHERLGINRKDVEKAPYQRLLAEAKLGQEITISDAGNQYNLQKIMGFIMTEKQLEKAGVNITVNGNVAAVSAGDNNTVTGTINLNASQQNDVAELQKSLTILMKNVQSADANFEIKSGAYAELKQIREHLGSLEQQTTPETKSKLRSYLTRFKDGSLAAFKLLKAAKGSEKTIAWAMEKAFAVGSWLV